MDFEKFNEFRKYKGVGDFYRRGEYVKSNVLCMLLNGKSLKGEKKNE